MNICKKSQKNCDLYGFSLSGYLDTSSVNGVPKDNQSCKMFVLGENIKLENFFSELNNVPIWEREKAKTSKKAVFVLHSSEYPIFVVKFNKVERSQNSFTPELLSSPYAVARDLAGKVFEKFKSVCCESSCIDFDFRDVSDIQKLGFLTGLEVASYSFKSIMSLKAKEEQSCYLEKYPRLVFCEISQSILREASIIGKSINLARHLVNIPGSTLDPQAYSNFVEATFKSSDCIKVDVWGLDKIKKEGMALLEAVAKGSEKEPALVHLRYRPKSKNTKQPIALVGKGITFDSGGLDIKPSSSMLLMKKDMGGAAALVGVAYYLDQMKLDVPCDIYLSLAENAVSAKSMKPGDIYTARSGATVEIGNTDAEGRLVLADALDLAVSQTGVDEVCSVIDLATLTGANRVGLGTAIAGMYANNSKLIERSFKASCDYGDPVWNMPLYKEYDESFKSNVADFSNNSSDSRGAAIGAALFLKRFVKDKPWAHFDIYAWTDKAQGACREVGANGQGVQLLIGILKSM